MSGDGLPEGEGNRDRGPEPGSAAAPTTPSAALFAWPRPGSTGAARLRDAALSLSLANLLLFRNWSSFLPSPATYYRAQPRSLVELAALLAALLLIAATAWALLRFARRRKGVWLEAARAGLIVAWLLVIGGFDAELRVRWDAWPPPDAVMLPIKVLVIAGVLALLAVPLTKRGLHRVGRARLAHRLSTVHRLALRVSSRALTVMLPLVLIFVGYGSIALLAQDEDAYSPSLAAPIVDGTSPPRVVWIVLDEFDYELAVADRPAGLSLPALDAFAAESVEARQAFAASERTLESVPAMMAGRFVDDAMPTGPADLRVTWHDGPAGSWADDPGLFSELREQGRNIGVTGFFHPYCRVLADYLTDCHFDSYYEPVEPDPPRRVREHLQELLDLIPDDTAKRAAWEYTGAKKIDVTTRQEDAAALFRSQTEAAIRMAQDASLDLVYLHMNAPHLIGTDHGGYAYYDGQQRQFATGEADTYYDQLLLADHFFARLRAGMEAQGLWENTTVIITSDHGFRGELWGSSTIAPDAYRTSHRVPLWVRLAGAQEGAVVDDPVNLVLMRELVLRVQDGTLSTPQHLVEWLAQRGGGPAPRYDER